MFYTDGRYWSKREILHFITIIPYKNRINALKSWISSSHLYFPRSFFWDFPFRKKRERQAKSIAYLVSYLLIDYAKCKH